MGFGPDSLFVNLKYENETIPKFDAQVREARLGEQPEIRPDGQHIGEAPRPNTQGYKEMDTIRNFQLIFNCIGYKGPLS